MSKYKFGATSRSRLATCCPELQLLMQEAIRDDDCPCDFGIVCGFRGQTEQNRAFYSGKTNARWGESDHNFRKGDTPWSLAVDIAPYANHNFIWDAEDSRYEKLATHILSVARRLGLHIEWGGTYRIGPTKSPDKVHYSIKLR